MPVLVRGTFRESVLKSSLNDNVQATTVRSTARLSNCVPLPANMHVGLHQDEIARKGWAVSAAEAVALCGRPDVAIVDLREKSERDKHGIIPGSLDAPYPDLQEHINAGGMLHELAAANDKRIVFYCAFGERSAMAVQATQDVGLRAACHIQGGIHAWKKANGPLAR
jgi:sulfur dioxygenase